MSVLYSTKPVLSDTFDPGALTSNVIDRTVSWINYYRSLSGLPAVSQAPDSNTLAQISSAVMAYSESDPYKDQHGLANTAKPIGLPDVYWNRAVLGTKESNLYFGFPTTIGAPVRELMLDNTNVSGLDAGHRAWFISPYLSTVGVGMASSQAGRTYESVLVMNSPDQNRTPALNVVSYPGNGLFPVEELTTDKGITQIPWSIGFATGTGLVTDSTTITVQNLTEGSSGTVSPTYSGTEAYQGTVLSFLPPTAISINDHSEYRVTVSGLNSDTMPSYTYTFKTFSEKGSGVNGTVSDSAAENTTTN